MKTREQIEREIKPIIGNLNALTSYILSECKQTTELAVEEELKVEHILTGIDELGKEWFKKFGTTSLLFPLEEMYQCIQNNFSPSRALGNLSIQNWRFEKKTDLDEQCNKSLEKILEKKISKKAGPQWANQVPAASGYCGSGGRKRSIDLVFKSDDSASVVFYELKVKLSAGTAFEAVIELLGYGLLYVYSRKELHEYKETPYMKAHNLKLGVLGTSNYYKEQRGKNYCSNSTSNAYLVCAF